MSYGLEELVSLKGHTDRVWNVAWSPSGHLLASCGGDKTVRIWTPETVSTSSLESSLRSNRWVCRAVLEEAHQRSIRRIAWSPDGRYLACASFDATTSIWKHDSQTGDFECIATLEGHENEVKCVAWDVSGTLLATCSRDKSVWIWSMESESDFECTSVLHGHTQDVKSVVFHPNRELLVSCSYDNHLKLWVDDGDDWTCSETLQGHTSTVWEAAFSPVGDQLVSCSDDTNLIVWKSLPSPGGGTKWQNVCTLSGFHRRCIYSVDWSPLPAASSPTSSSSSSSSSASFGGFIATGGGDDAIRIFRQDDDGGLGVGGGGRANGGSTPFSISTPSFSCVVTKEKAHGSDVNCVRWNPKVPGLLASCGDDNQIKVFALRQYSGAGFASP